MYNSQYSTSFFEKIKKLNSTNKISSGSFGTVYGDNEYAYKISLHKNKYNSILAEGLLYKYLQIKNIGPEYYGSFILEKNIKLIENPNEQPSDMTLLPPVIKSKKKQSKKPPTIPVTLSLSNSPNSLSYSNTSDSIISIYKNQNPDKQNPDKQNPDKQNPDKQNPDKQNPDEQESDIEISFNNLNNEHILTFLYPIDIINEKEDNNNNIYYYHILITKRYTISLDKYLENNKLNNTILEKFTEKIDMLLNNIKEENIFCGDINIRNMLLDNYNNLIFNDFDNTFCCIGDKISKKNIQICDEYDRDMYILSIKFIIFINSIEYLKNNLDNNLIQYDYYNLKPLFYNKLKQIFRNQDIRQKFIFFLKFICDMNIVNNNLKNLIREYKKAIMNYEIRRIVDVSSLEDVTKEHIEQILNYYFGVKNKKELYKFYLNYSLYNSF